MPLNGELYEKIILKAGDSFGELSLIKNSLRTATIICLENSHFAVLNKKHFNSLLSLIILLIILNFCIFYIF